LKVCSELQFKTSPGRLFQMKGAEYEYERLANSVFVLGIVSSLSVTLCIVAKRCVLEQKLLLTAYMKSYMRNRLVPK